MKLLILMALLTGCGKSGAKVAEDMYPGLHCFGDRVEFALCINRHSENFVCFASQRANTAFCLKAASRTELTNVERDEHSTGR
jgi:hypothetical protein